MKLEIDRTKWLRGEGSDASRLLRPSDGKMCCLGFACLAAGYAPVNIENKSTVKQVTDMFGRKPNIEPLFIPRHLDEPSKYENWDVYEAFQANDQRYADSDMTLTEEEFEAAREKRIVELLAKIGFEVTFVN